MNKNAIVLSISMASLFLTTMPAAAVTTVDFDGVTAVPITWSIPNGYAALNWSARWGVMDADCYGAIPSGYANGTVSPDYVAYNSMGLPVNISGDPFDLVGGYFTAAWRNGLLIEVEGYRSGCLVYSTEFTVNTASPTWVQFDWAGVDTVSFASSGGVPQWSKTGTQFALDNLTLDTAAHAPAPGAILLAGIGAGVTGWLRRRRSL